MSASRWAGNRTNQPHPTGRVELFRDRRLEWMLFVGSRLGRKEESAASDACPRARGFRLATVEQEVAVREAGSSQRLPASSTMVTPESQVSRSGLITQIGRAHV